MWYIHILACYSAIKDKVLIYATTWKIMLNERSRSQTATNGMTSLFVVLGINPALCTARQVQYLNLVRFHLNKICKNNKSRDIR